MLDPMIGSIVCVAFNFAPRDWVLCDGTVYPTSEFNILSQYLGNTYGGDGTTTFAVPDLRSRAPRHIGPINALGQTGGTEQVTLTQAQSPSHSHSFQASSAQASLAQPSLALLAPAAPRGIDAYSSAATTTELTGTVIEPQGMESPQAHSNLQPFLAMNFVIATQGSYVPPGGEYPPDDEPCTGEIRIFASNTIPTGWAPCNGQLIDIAKNAALFSLISNIYGGDGHSTFALPDLRGRLPLGAGQGPGLSAYTLGASGGQDLVSLDINQTPLHTHLALGSPSAPDASSPAGNLLSAEAQIYTTAVDNTALKADALSIVGKSMPHENRMPSLALNFCICLAGYYPPRN
jgi:microcystin-dependent protein